MFKTVQTPASEENKLSNFHMFQFYYNIFSFHSIFSVSLFITQSPNTFFVQSCEDFETITFKYTALPTEKPHLWIFYHCVNIQVLNHKSILINLALNWFTLMSALPNYIVLTIALKLPLLILHHFLFASHHII